MINKLFREEERSKLLVDTTNSDLKNIYFCSIIVSTFSHIAEKVVFLFFVFGCCRPYH